MTSTLQVSLFSTQQVAAPLEEPEDADMEMIRAGERFGCPKIRMNWTNILISCGPQMATMHSWANIIPCCSEKRKKHTRTMQPATQMLHETGRFTYITYIYHTSKPNVGKYCGNTTPFLWSFLDVVIFTQIFRQNFNPEAWSRAENLFPWSTWDVCILIYMNSWSLW